MGTSKITFNLVIDEHIGKTQEKDEALIKVSALCLTDTVTTFPDTLPFSMCKAS